MDNFIGILYNVLVSNIFFMLLAITGVALGIYHTKKYFSSYEINPELTAEQKYPIIKFLHTIWLIAVLVATPYLLTAYSMQSNRSQFVSRVCIGMLPRVDKCVSLTSQQCPDLVAKKLTDCYESLPKDSWSAQSSERQQLQLARRNCFKTSMIKELTENYSTDNTPSCQQLIESRVYEYVT